MIRGKLSGRIIAVALYLPLRVEHSRSRSHSRLRGVYPERAKRIEAAPFEMTENARLKCKRVALPHAPGRHDKPDLAADVSYP
jgi:hypothetical protein